MNENTPLKQKYSDYELKEAVFNQNNMEIKENFRKKPEIPCENSKKHKKIKNIEKSIEEKENSLNLSKPFLKKSSGKKAKNRSFTPKSRADSQHIFNPISKNTTNMPEIILLNKKIMMLKRNLEEERVNLNKEKQKNREYKEEMERILRKIKKLEIRNEKNSQLEADYLKLMESFEKS